MKKSILALIMVAQFAQAEQLCFSCPPEPLTQEEIKLEKERSKLEDFMFKKVRYILGAAYNVTFFKSKIMSENPYKNIPDFIKRNKKIKEDIRSLRDELSKNDFFVLSAITGEVGLCVEFAVSADEYCGIALRGLKSFYWSKVFGTAWSGHKYSKEDWKGWAGFSATIEKQ